MANLDRRFEIKEVSDGKGCPFGSFIVGASRRGGGLRLRKRNFYDLESELLIWNYAFSGENAIN